MPKSSKPVVSIILPTYNRAQFLPEAFDAIKSQTFKDWELIVVDDGSTDNTNQIVEEFAKTVPQNVIYVYQENQGPAAARNRGLEIARGRYIAFYDSDDLWLPHHLERCVAALEENPDVDWVFAACKLVEHPSGKVVNSNHLSKSLQKLYNTSKFKKNIYIISSSSLLIKMVIGGDVSIGLQHSVIRHVLFEQIRLNPALKIGEDKVLVIEAIKNDYNFAFLDQIHVIYRIHQKNLSLSAKESSLENKVKKNEEYILALLSIKNLLNLREKICLYQQVSKIYFWNIGYIYVENRRYKKAISYFFRGICYYPFSFKYIKTLFVTLIKMLFIKY